MMVIFNRFLREMVLMGMMLFVAGRPLLANDAVRPEIRAIWADAFHDGFKTPDQVDQLVDDCLKANLNTIIVQVRRRGDAFYNKSIEPRTEDPGLAPGFDALQYLIEKAHAKRIEVHAWLNTLVAWNAATPPKAANHVWNLHGPNSAGAANWIAYFRKYNSINRKWSDKLYSSFFLDPGHPTVVDYTAAVYLNVVKNYDVDGIHLDYSRYDGLGWGYNATSVARYNNRYGKSGLPLPDDPLWMQWRREQTANLVRKIYLKAIALKPSVKVSAAVVTWGDGPVTDADWEQSRGYTVAGQDWRGWLEEGILDLAIPMNYFSDWNKTRQSWYNKWIEWEKDHQYGRQIVIGPGLYLQYIENSLDQIRRAQAPSAQGNYAAGVSLYAYGWNNLYSNDDYKENLNPKGLPRQPHQYLPESNNWLFSLLAKAGSYYDPVLKRQIATEPVFSTPAAIPDMPWKSQPVSGYLMGTLTGSTGQNYDGVKIIVKSADLTMQREVATDGGGWYGLTELRPGRYRVWADHPDFVSTCLEVTVQAGQVSEANFLAAEENPRFDAELPSNPGKKEGNR
jgi:uncharacterized lipoprotein YddW (UPF0748 family)